MTVPPLHSPPTKSRNRDNVWLAVILTALIGAGLALVVFAVAVLVPRLVPEQREIDGPVLDAEGPHAFRDLQDDGVTPIGFDPCKAIDYTINPDGAPDGWESLVEDAVEQIELASGLSFDYLGPTDERPFETYYTPMDEPVVIGWGDDEEFTDLEGDIAGLGGSVYREDPDGTYYVAGSVALDTDFYDDSDYSRASHLAVLVHELGHVVGLDHVDDSSQIMYEKGARSDGFGDGDLQGLAALGQLPCRGEQPAS